MSQLEKVIHLRNSLESKSSQTKQREWDIYFNWHAEGSKSFQDSKTDLLKESLQKGNKKLNTQELPKTKDCKTSSILL